MGINEDRFWAKVDKSGDCWIWKASRSAHGYGYFGVDRRVRKAHRVSWELANGPIPTEVEIDHSCLNRSCVNPSHLRQSTRKQNMENQAGAHANSISGERGVTWHPRTGKWRAKVGHNKRTIHVGLFPTLAEAAEAARQKRNELFTHNERDRK